MGRVPKGEEEIVQAQRKSRMTSESLDELTRRHKAGEDMSGPFDLKTGKPIKQSKKLAAINAELAALKFE